MRGIGSILRSGDCKKSDGIMIRAAIPILPSKFCLMSSLISSDEVVALAHVKDREGLLYPCCLHLAFDFIHQQGTAAPHWTIRPNFR